jgi:ADP-heptose:LPS heptosyltransferase
MSSDLAHFYSRTREARKVIVVDLGFLGDTVHLVPALWELKRNYSQAEIHVLTSTVGREVLRLAPCADRTWGMEMYPETRTFGEQWEMVKALRRERFDVAFNFSGADRTNFMTALSGARWRVAHRGGRWHFYNSWLIPLWIPQQDPNQIVFEQRRQMLTACGLTIGPPRFDLDVDKASADWAAGVVQGPTVHISPNSSKAVKEWPLEHYVVLIRKMWGERPELKVVVSSSARLREGERIASLEKSVKDARFQRLPDTMSIPQLAAVLNRCVLHIGSDSGVLHLAYALNIPSISFLREQPNFGAFMPVGPRHRVLSVPCSCIDNHNESCERLNRSECLARIDPEHVAAVVSEQFKVTSC